MAFAQKGSGSFEKAHSKLDAIPPISDAKNINKSTVRPAVIPLPAASPRGSNIFETTIPIAGDRTEIENKAMIMFFVMTWPRLFLLI